MRLLKNRNYWIGAAAALALGLILGVATNSSSYQSCKTEQQYQYSDPYNPDGFEAAVTFLVCEGDAIDANGELITAIATLAIAAFTFTLWSSTRRLVFLTEDEFYATHRPKLVVRFVQGPTIESEKDLAFAYVTIVNVGDSAATIVGLGKDLAFRGHDFEWFPPGLNVEMEPISHRKLDSGDTHVITIRSHPRKVGSDISLFWHQFVSYKKPHPDGVVCAVGEVRYVDAVGKVRGLGFCRIYDPIKKNWKADADSDLEYQD